MSPPRDIPVLAPYGRSINETADVSAAMAEIYEHNKNAVVQVSVTAPNGKVFGGSGVLVKDGNDVMVVTNAHVANNSRLIEFRNLAGETFAARISKLADTEDLALLKPEGVKINPKMAVDIGDPQKLTAGQITYGISHPNGYGKPVISEGPVVRSGTLDAMAPEMVNLTRLAIEKYYKGDSNYRAAAEAFIQTPRIDTRVPAEHGSSGGGLFDKEGKLVGIIHAVPDQDNPNETLSISSDRVKALLNDPKYRFDFTYGRESMAVAHPNQFGAKLVGLGALAFNPISRRVAAPVIGSYYGVQALDDAHNLFQENTFRSKAYYAEKLALDGGTFAAGMLSFVPRFRLASTLAVGARLAVDALTDLTDSRPVLEKVQPRSAQTSEPLFWDISHH